MNDCINIFISGDFCPSWGTFGTTLQDTAVESVFGDLLDDMLNADMAITNLECPLTTSNAGIKKTGPNLKSPPEMSGFLQRAGFNLVTMANNHIYDYGQDGLEDTIDVLCQNDIAYVGAGRDLPEAQKTYYKEINGITIAIVNFCEIEFACASTEHGGANPMDVVDNCHQIQEATNKADHVIVIIHGGHEFYHYPSPKTQKRYRFYAEQGASAVIAHHTHCIGGYEYWNEVPIFYSLGNFFFPAQKKMPDAWYEGYALRFILSKVSVSFDLLPYRLCDNGHVCTLKDSCKEILLKIERISSILQDPDQLQRQWKEFIDEKAMVLASVSGFGRYKIAVLRRLGLLEMFYKSSHLKYILAIIRCQAHNETVSEVLTQYLE